MLLYLGGEPLRTIYKTLDDEEETFKNAVTVLNKHFEKKRNVAYECFVFRQATQAKEESMKCYVTRLRDLGKHCKFEDYSANDAVIDQVIEHCHSSHLRKKLLGVGDTITVEKVISLATALEDVDQQASVMTKTEQMYSPTAHSEGGSGEDNQTAYGLRETSNQRNSHQPSNIGTSSRPPQASWKSKAQCFGCGQIGHIKRDYQCPARGKTCNYCRRRDHFDSVCLEKKKAEESKVQNPSQMQKSGVQLLSTSEPEEEYLFSLNSGHKYDVALMVDEIPVKFKIDSGASVLVVSKKVGQKLEKTGKLKIQKSNVKIFPYGSEKSLPLEGVIYSNVRHGNNHILGRIHVVSNWDSECILDRKSAEKLGLLQIYTESVNSLETPLAKVIQEEFPKVYSGLGKLKDVEIKFNINKKVKPISQHLHRIPFHVRKKWT